MKIIHCSDLHLDSRMESNLTPQQAQQRNAEILTTFSRMVTYGEEHGVSVILIAGDLFDTDRISESTVSCVLDRISRSPKIDFLYLRGNHDESRRAFCGRELPENLRLFEDSWKRYSYEDVAIYGIELTKDNCLSLYDSLSPDSQSLNIVALHGQVSTQPGEDCISLPQLRNKHIHYLALGHLHSYQREKLDLTGEYCYCGCLEGRGFDECGEKGFVLLNTENHRIEASFVPFAKRTLYDLPVDITGLSSVSQILGAMKTAAEKVSSESLVKFTLTGTYTLDTQKDLSFLQNMLSPNYYFVKIKDESRLAIEKESYENDISLKGEFVRMVMASDLSQEDKERIICTGIQALSGEAITL